MQKQSSQITRRSPSIGHTNLIFNNPNDITGGCSIKTSIRNINSSQEDFESQPQYNFDDMKNKKDPKTPQLIYCDRRNNSIEDFSKTNNNKIKSSKS